LNNFKLWENERLLVMCTKSKAYDYGPPNTFLFDCARCGSYVLSENNLKASDIQINKNGKEIISHWVRKNQVKGKEIVLDMQLINNILKDITLPKPEEQVNNLIFWLGESSENPQDELTLNISNLVPVLGTTDDSGVRYVLDYVRNLGLVECEEYTSNTALLRLTSPGWDYYYELKSLDIAGEYIFMAMKYGSEDIEKLYKDFLKPAVLETGFELRRLDEKMQAGLIDIR
jgi:hypothetical protein